MKKQLIATLVAGIIIVIWQFLSWAALNVHGSEMRHTDKQDAILEFLGQNLQPGSYMLPQPAPGSSSEAQQEFMKNYAGKPWATISYHPSMNMGMGLNLVRGFVTDLVAAFLLVWLLMNFSNLTFRSALLGSLAVGAVAYLTIPYLNSIWFETGTMGYTWLTWSPNGAWWVFGWDGF